MPQVNISIGDPNKTHLTYKLSEDKIPDLIKFISSLNEEDNLSLKQEIEIGLTEVKNIIEGKVERKTLKDIINAK
ncbi:MAG: hypothetical protein IH598_12220 [Bacteroidales bacterium]|nr:hypothetical protein [Bacteroidales bacterium]